MMARCVCALFLLCTLATPAAAAPPPSTLSAFEGLEWRFAGPMRGGRVNAVAGHPADAFTFYAGYTGGGVWKTDDGGVTWRNLSDGWFGVGSIGALAVAESAPDTIYVGTGEHALRGDVSHGDGVYKSEDGGETWKHIGLERTRQIAEILVHPSDPNIAYVAALGSFTGPSAERGVFRTRDGGETWERILFVSENAGAIEIELGRQSPELLYAATWDVRRFPWGIRSAGPGSRIYRSRDGGDNWTDLSEKPGLPTGMKEKIGLGIGAAPGRLWALVSAESGRGVFRSDDYGETWIKTQSEKKLLARTYYFNHMTADPVDADTVYILNDRLWRSTDGGVTFEERPHNHADHHDLWIDPYNNARMIDGSDGGAEVSFNGGDTWSTLLNQPTGQFYTLTLDDAQPYNLYGSQQDWSTIILPSRQRPGRGGDAGFFDIAYSEAGRVALDQRDEDTLYISDHHWLLKFDKRSGAVQYAGPRDETNYGWGTADIRYRFNWTFPILASQHDLKTLYSGSQYVHRSTDSGRSWRVISPDLTRADPNKLERTPLPGDEGASNPEYWGPLTRDSNGDHWFSTLYSVVESPIKKGVVWTGSDDGVVSLTRNGGREWRDVTPSAFPDYAMITHIAPSPHDAATAYVTASAYKLDNYETLAFRTTDFGQTWQRITTGLPDGTIMRSLAADPEKPGLLFAGSESGAFVSHNDGEEWESLQLNLPAVPIYDMQVHQGDLVLATHGRGFWILDDLNVIRQHLNAKNTRLIAPEPVTLWAGRISEPRLNGLRLHYKLSRPAIERLSIEISDAEGGVIKALDARGGDLANAPGLQAAFWDLRYPNARRVPGVVTRGGQNIGPKAPPGDYLATLNVDGEQFTQAFRIERDPRNSASQKDLEEQFALLSAIRDQMDALNAAVISSRWIQDQLSAKRGGALTDDARELVAHLREVEQTIVQVSAEARKDLHANPVMLNDKFYRLANFISRADAKPTQTQLDMFEEFSTQAEEILSVYEHAIRVELPAINAALDAAGHEAISVDPPAFHSEAGAAVEGALMPR